MSDKSKTIRVQGFSTLGLLGVLFVALKLTGHIDWSWFWVTMPFWAGAGIALGILALFLTGAGIALLVAYTVDGWRDWRFNRRQKEARR